MSGSSVVDGQHQPRLDHDGAADLGGGVHVGNRPAAADDADVEGQAVAGHHRPAELHVVDAAQEPTGAAGGVSGRLRSSALDAWVSASSISTPGISGTPGKVALDELLADADGLDRPQVPPSSSDTASTSTAGNRYRWRSRKGAMFTRRGLEAGTAGGRPDGRPPATGGRPTGRAAWAPRRAPPPWWKRRTS